MLDLKLLSELAEAHRDALSLRVRTFDLGGRAFDFARSKAVMGVINLSPDSWYRESVCLSTDAAIQRGRILSAQGADLIDVGAESTLAQASRRDGPSQKHALLPVIKALRKEGILVSAETYDADVARRCLEAGTTLLNLTGTQAGEAIYQAVAEHEAGVIICYVQGPHVRAVADLNFTEDPISTMESYFDREVEAALRCGVQRIFLDPGLGFYYRNLQDGTQRVRHQMRTFLNTFRLRRLGWPICHALPHAFEFFGEEVRCAEPFFAALAALGGTDLLRTHEVARTKAVLTTLAAF